MLLLLLQGIIWACAGIWCTQSRFLSFYGYCLIYLKESFVPRVQLSILLVYNVLEGSLCGPCSGPLQLGGMLQSLTIELAQSGRSICRTCLFGSQWRKSQELIQGKHILKDRDTIVTAKQYIKTQRGAGITGQNQRQRPLPWASIPHLGYMRNKIKQTQL